MDPLVATIRRGKDGGGAKSSRRIPRTSPTDSGKRFRLEPFERDILRSHFERTTEMVIVLPKRGRTRREGDPRRPGPSA
jgi:hypothetical protein